MHTWHHYSRVQILIFLQYSRRSVCLWKSILALEIYAKLSLVQHLKYLYLILRTIKNGLLLFFLVIID